MLRKPSRYHDLVRLVHVLSYHCPSSTLRLESVWVRKTKFTNKRVAAVWSVQSVASRLDYRLACSVELCWLGRHSCSPVTRQTADSAAQRSLARLVQHTAPQAPSALKLQQFRFSDLSY